MEDVILIPALDFCKSHRVTLEIVHQLNEYGLIQIVARKDMVYIPIEQVKKLEQIIVFHRDLDINLQGIDTILSLLERIENMQNHITALENKLQRFL